MKVIPQGKFRQRKLRGARGQNALEYTMIIAAAAVALTAMSLYVQRAMQANLKSMEDQVNAIPVNP